MRVAKGRLNWGVFFILLGAVPLAYHQGVINQSQIGDAWRLWPLIVVGIGVGFILSRTPAYFVGGLIVAATMGLIFGSLFAVGPNIGCGRGTGSVANVSRAGTFDGPASVQLNLQCGSAEISASNDNQWHVDAFNDGSHGTTIASDASFLRVDTARNGGDWFNRSNDTWHIALPAQSQMNLTTTMDLGEATFHLNGVTLNSATFTMDLGSLHVDLTGSHVDRLNVQTNLGSAFLELDGATDVTGDVKTSLGSLKICAPSDLGVQIKSNSSLSSESFGALGMSKSGDVWQTSNYQSAAHKAALNVDTSLGSLELHRAGGCK